VNVTLIVNNPTITPSASPNPVTLVIGGSSQPVTVSTTTDPGFRASPITYTFSGFPGSSIPVRRKRRTLRTTARDVQLLVRSRHDGGNFTGTLTGSYIDPSATRSRDRFRSPSRCNSRTSPRALPADVNVCDGGPAASDSINLAPLAGYTGRHSSYSRRHRNYRHAIIAAGESDAAVAVGAFTVRASGATAGCKW